MAKKVEVKKPERVSRAVANRKPLFYNSKGKKVKSL